MANQNETKEMMSEFGTKLDSGLSAIRRYDEIICDKAQKHSLVEMKLDMVKSCNALSESVSEAYN